MPDAYRVIFHGVGRYEVVSDVGEIGTGCIGDEPTCRRECDRLNGKPVITTVYSFTNGMIAVFDQRGHQMPEFQGRTAEMFPKIRAAGFIGEIPYGSWNPDA